MLKPYRAFVFSSRLKKVGVSMKNTKKIMSLWFFLAVSGMSLVFALAGDRLDEMVEMIEDEISDSANQDALIEAAEAYLQERDAVLTTLSSLIAVTTDDEQANEWESTVDDLSDIPELVDVDDALSSEEALELYDLLMDEEQEWVSALSVLNTASYRDQLIALKLRLQNMTELLEEKWQGFLNEDGKLDQKELEIFADVYDLYRNFIEDMNAAREKVQTTLKAVGEAATKADKFLETGSSAETDLVKFAGAAIKEAVGFYVKTESDIGKNLPTLEQLTDAELKVIVLFKETREDTALFIRENGFDKMKALYTEAENELKEFANVGTDGQQDDTEVFVDKVLASLSKHVSDGEKIYNDFVAKHNLKFFGPIGPDIKEALLEHQVWLTEEDEWRNLDLEEYLKNWRDETKEIIEVNLSLSGISDEERERIEEALEPAIEEMDNALTEERFARFLELFLGPLIASRAELEEELE
jgi:hypothetical protein